MTSLRVLLREGRKLLAGTPTETPDLDAAILLSHVMRLNRLELQTSRRVPDDAQREAYIHAVLERARGVPVAYITGQREFWGLSFTCDRRALIPRPETELLVEKALELGQVLQEKQKEPLRVLDLCTGTGCVGIAVASEHPEWRITLADISPGALALASVNAVKILGADRVQLVESDLFEALDGDWDLIVSNPPYLSPEETAACLAQGWEEPAMALDGGGDGSALPLRLISQAGPRLVAGGVLLLEAAPTIKRALEAALSASTWKTLGPWKDLGGHWRVWGGRRL